MNFILKIIRGSIGINRVFPPERDLTLSKKWMRKYKKLEKGFSFEIFKNTFPFDCGRQNLYVMGLDKKALRRKRRGVAFSELPYR